MKISVSFNPVGSWGVVAVAAVVVTALTLWAYAPRLRATTGAWRWFALGLRLAAVLLCLLAALRPSVVYQEKTKQPTSLIFLTDDSTSMNFSDEVSGQKRWDLARKTLAEAREAAKGLGEGLTVKYYRFHSGLTDDPEGDGPGPAGRETALGVALLDAVERESGQRVASVFVLSDGTNNFGLAPLTAARQLKAQNVPVVTVGFGSEGAGLKSRDLAVRDLVTSPTVFVKNQMQLKGNLLARGFANQTVDVDLLIDDSETPAATQRVRIPEGAELVPINGLKYIPQTPGEKKVTLRVKSREGELVATNNTISTYVSVLKGGLNVLFVQGPHFPWEAKYFMRAIGSSPDIRADLRVLKLPARDNRGTIPDEMLVPGSYDVYVLSDLAANYLTATQQALLARTVERGAGLIMLGGRSSFGAGGWGASPVGRVLPVDVSPRDGQYEPEGGVPFVPNNQGLENYLLQIGRDRAETARLWAGLPPLNGVSRLGALKSNANVLALGPGARGEPVMVAMSAGAGRSLAFGGETWVWARLAEGLAPHKKFWRQVIFWLARKEDKGETDVKITLDARRAAVGQRLDFGVKVRDAKGDPIPNLTFVTKAEKEGGPGEKFSEPIELFNQDEGMRGAFSAPKAPPGDYRVTVVATRDGKEVGRDSARFLVYQDDREMENPAADRDLLRKIAQATDGKSLAPEELSKYLKSLKGQVFSESLIETERKVWDNWPFLLLFTTLLTLEWWLRKRHGWV